MEKLQAGCWPHENYTHFISGQEKAREQEQKAWSLKKTYFVQASGTEAEEGDCMYGAGATYPAHFPEPVMSGQVSLFPAL